MLGIITDRQTETCVAAFCFETHFVTGLWIVKIYKHFHVEYLKLDYGNTCFKNTLKYTSNILWMSYKVKDLEF